MSGLFGSPSMPEVQRVDPVDEKAAADARAAQEANDRIAVRKKRSRQSSLLAAGMPDDAGAPMASTVLASGKTALGQ